MNDAFSLIIISSIFTFFICMTFYLLFTRNKNRDNVKLHIQYWKEELEINKNGLTTFQLDLSKRLEEILTKNNLKHSATTEIAYDLENHEREVRTIIVSLQTKNPNHETTAYSNSKDSKFWIYHDMAEFHLKSAH